MTADTGEGEVAAAQELLQVDFSCWCQIATYTGSNRGRWLQVAGEEWDSILKAPSHNVE
jgi:hypothetical protein